MKIATEEELDQAEAERLEQPIEFTYLPLGQITAAEQIRQAIDTGSEGFKGLMESIRAKGVLEPLLVARQDDGAFRLIIGERRFRACQMLNLPAVPVWIVDQGGTKADVITLQLIENLARENLDPIDEANAYLEFFRSQMGAMDAAGMINLIITYERAPERVESGFAASLAAIAKITGKSYSSMRNLFSLLTLPETFRTAIKEGKIGVSQGYILAAHLDNPQLYAIFKAILKKPVTNQELKRLLEKTAASSGATEPRMPFTGIYSKIRTVRTALEKDIAAFTRPDMEKLVAELKAFCAFVEEQVQKQAGS